MQVRDDGQFSDFGQVKDNCYFVDYWQVKDQGHSATLDRLK